VFRIRPRGRYRSLYRHICCRNLRYCRRSVRDFRRLHRRFLPPAASMPITSRTPGWQVHLRQSALPESSGNEILDSGGIFLIFSDGYELNIFSGAFGTSSAGNQYYYFADNGSFDSNNPIIESNGGPAVDGLDSATAPEPAPFSCSAPDSLAWHLSSIERPSNLRCTRSRIDSQLDSRFGGRPTIPVCLTFVAQKGLRREGSRVQPVRARSSIL